MAFCKIMFIGNLGRDPEMRYMPNGRPVTQFSVAVSHSKPDGQGGYRLEVAQVRRVPALAPALQLGPDDVEAGVDHAPDEGQAALDPLGVVPQGAHLAQVAGGQAVQEVRGEELVERRGHSPSVRRWALRGGGRIDRGARRAGHR